MQIKSGKEYDRLVRRSTNFTPFYLIVCLCFCAVLFFRLLLVFFPASNTAGSENGILYFIQRALANETLYSDPAKPVYAIAQYTPLYYYLIAGIARIFSIQHHQIRELFIINRAVSLVLDLCTCFVVTRIAKNVFNLSSNKASVTGIVAFIFLLPWSRIDNLCILFWFISLYFFLKAISLPQNNFYFFLSIFFSLLSVLSKQSGITIIISIATWLLVTRQFKRFGFYCITIGLLFFSTLCVLSFSIDLHALFKNVVLGVNNGFSLKNYFTIFVGYYTSGGLFFCICFLLTVFMLVKQKEQAYRFFLWVLVIQFLLSNLFALKYGSALNYITEWMILMILALAVYSDKWTNLLSGIHFNAAIIVAAVIILSKTSNYLSPTIWYSDTSNFKSAEAHFKLEKSIADYLQTKNKNRNLLRELCDAVRQARDFTAGVVINSSTFISTRGYFEYRLL